MNRSPYAAYHGGSWKVRHTSHEQDCHAYWPFTGSDSEFGKLNEVLLYTPSRKPVTITDPEKVQHLRPVNWRKLKLELAGLARVLKKHGVNVRSMEGDWFNPEKPNLMFCRDHFFMTPWGAIIGRMASPVRAGEEKWAQKALADLGIPILGLIRGKGIFEGADALWLSPETVLIGVGNRTNREAFVQIKTILAEFNISAVPVTMPKAVQHLLGLLQVVDVNLALIRSEIVDRDLRRVLSQHRFKTIAVPEIADVTERQGMNIVTLSPRCIIMPKCCTNLKALYKRNGLTVTAEIAFEQGLNAAGGIACATGILSRSLHGL